MTSKVLLRLQNDEGFKKTYSDFVDLLTAYGVFEFLNTRGEPDFIDYGGNLHAMASQGAKSFGYFACLNDIKNFKEKYLTPPPPQVNPVDLATYGGRAEAVAKGYLTQEEKDELDRQDSNK